MPIKGRRASAPGRGGRGYDPKITIWAGGTEAPDEPARGDWMKIVASAGLAWNTAILQYLLDGDHQVNRDSSEFFGGVSIKLDRRVSGGEATSWFAFPVFSSLPAAIGYGPDLPGQVALPRDGEDLDSAHFQCR